MAYFSSLWSIRSHFSSKDARERREEPLPQAEVERALDKYCRPPFNSTTRTRLRLKATDFQHIAGLLKHVEAYYGDEQWSSIPRIYTVLRNINRLDAMRSFIDQHQTDFYLPYSEENLPDIIAEDSVSKAAFLNFQDCVLTDAVHLEKGSEGRHVHFGKDADEHFLHAVPLGEGGAG
jgi:hypothetical protein